MISISDVRTKFPQYSDLSDDELASALHTKFYADMPFNEFRSKIGLGAPQAPEQHTTGMGAARHGFLRSVLPTAAGIVAGGAAATAALPLSPIASGVAALGTGMAASTAVEAAQEAFLKANPHLASFLGLDEATAEAEEKEHPYASMAGQLAPQLLAFSPSTAAFRSIRNATTREAAKEIGSARLNAALGVGLGAGVEAGQQAMGDQPMDWTKVGMAGLAGALSQKETPLGEKLSGWGESLAGKGAQAAIKALRRPDAEPEISPPMPSPEVDKLVAGVAPPPGKNIPAELPELTDTHNKILDVINRFDEYATEGKDQPNGWVQQRNQIRKEIDPNLTDDDIRKYVRDLRKHDLLQGNNVKHGRYKVTKPEAPNVEGQPASSDINAAPTGESPVVPVLPKTTEGESVTQTSAGALDDTGGLPRGTTTEQTTGDGALDLGNVLDNVNPDQPPANPDDIKVIPVNENKNPTPSMLDLFSDKEPVESEKESEQESKQEDKQNTKKKTNKRKKPQETKENVRSEYLDRINNLKTDNVLDEHLESLANLTDMAHEADTPEEFTRLDELIKHHESLSEDPSYYKPVESTEEAPPSPTLQEHLEKGDINGAMEFLSKPIEEGETRSPIAQALAELIHSDDSLNLGQQDRGKYGNLKINLEGIEGYNARDIERLRNKSVPSSYDPKTNTLHFTREGLTEENFVHEMAHVFTVRELKSYNPRATKIALEKLRSIATALEAEEANIRFNPNISEEERKKLLNKNNAKQNSNSEKEDKLLRRSTAVDKIHSIFNDPAVVKLKAKYPEAFRNIYEFVSHAMSDPVFQRELANLRIPDPSYTFSSQTGVSAKQSGMLTRRIEKTIAALKDTIEDLKYEWSRAKTQEEKVNYAQEIAYNTTEIEFFQKKLDLQQDSVWNRLTDAIKEFFGITPRRAHGNVLLELSEAFGDILRPPTSKGIEGVGELYARRRRGEIKVVPPQPTFASGEDAFNYAVKGKENKIATDLAEIKKKKPFYERYLDTVVTLQNDRRYLKEYEQALADAGKLGFGENTNAIYTNLIHSAGIAQDLNTRYIMPHTTKMNDAINGYAKAKGLTLHEALSKLDIMYTALHEGERRAMWYLKNAPLDNEAANKFDMTYHDENGNPFVRNGTAEDHRKFILDQAKQNKDLERKVVNVNGEMKTPIAMYKEALQDIVSKHVTADGASPLRELRRLSKAMPTDINDQLYSVIGGYTKQQMDAGRDIFRRELADPKTGGYLRALTEHLKAVQDNTQMLSTRANYWTQPVSNLKALYGFEHYVPFKGLPVLTDSLHKAAAEDFEPSKSRKYGGGYALSQEESKGRISTSNNVLLQAMADGTASAMQVGRKNVAEAVANLSKTYKSFGKKVEDIAFDEREAKGEELAKKGANTFFRYMPDGKIEIYEVKDPRMVEAIRRAYSDQNDVMHKMIDGVGWITKKIAIGHTRLNPAFAPYNFMRHALTDFTAIIPEMGFKKGAEFMQRLSGRVIEGGLATTLKTVSLYEKGDFAALKELAKKDPFVRDTLEFIEQGGRTSWVQGLTNKAQYDQLLQQIKLQGGVAKTFDQISKMADHYGDMFELTVRTSVYQTAKEFYTDKLVKDFTKQNNRPPTADERVKLARSDQVKQMASSFTKEMENYEHTGRFGKQLGSLYAFWRANTTGAVRALDALMPAFLSEKDFIRQLPVELQHEQQIQLAREEIIKKHNREPTGAEMAMIRNSKAVIEAKAASDKLTARFKERQGAARLLLGAMIGAGMVAYNLSYLMAPTDESGRNEVAYDNKDMWVRAWRLPIGKDRLGKDNDFLQIPWGFGGGALAGIGAQIMSAIYGHSTLQELAGNTTLLARDSYFPIPAAEFNPKDDPLAWAVDSVLPSALRPFVEYKMNKDTFGRQVHTTNMSKYGGAYTSGDYIPQMYQDASRWLAKISNGDILWDPNSLHFFASNFADGYARVGQMVWDTAYGIKGDKAIDPKTALLPFGNYIGKHTSFDAKQFADTKSEVENMKNALQQFSMHPEQYRRYVAAHPQAPMLVEAYNKITGGPIKQIREAMDALQSSDRPPKEYADKIRQLKEMRDMVMRRYNDMYREANP